MGPGLKAADLKHLYGPDRSFSYTLAGLYVSSYLSEHNGSQQPLAVGISTLNLELSLPLGTGEVSS